MKKVLFVVMAVAIVAVAVLSYFAYYFYSQSVEQANKNKTQAARDARHKKPEIDVEQKEGFQDETANNGQV